VLVGLEHPFAGRAPGLETRYAKVEDPMGHSFVSSPRVPGVVED
jgi:hypothetical protein